jgi:hypothetical protein
MVAERSSRTIHFVNLWEQEGRSIAHQIAISSTAIIAKGYGGREYIGHASIGLNHPSSHGERTRRKRKNTN